MRPSIDPASGGGGDEQLVAPLAYRVEGEIGVADPESGGGVQPAPRLQPQAHRAQRSVRLNNASQS